jgi:hypothetical protein
MDNNETGEITKVNAGKRFPIISLPEIVSSHIIQEYRRFINTTSVSGFLTIYDLLNQFMIATSTTLLNSYIDAIRIKKIRMLCPVTTQGTSVSCSLQPYAPDTTNNLFSAVPEKYIDTSASIDIPAYLSLNPKITTPLGAWHRAILVDSNLVQVIAPPGTTFDILFEYIILSGASASTYTRAVTGATVGVLTTKNMITNFVPVSRPALA